MLVPSRAFVCRPSSSTAREERVPVLPSFLFDILEARKKRGKKSDKSWRRWNIALSVAGGIKKVNGACPSLANRLDIHVRSRKRKGDTHRASSDERCRNERTAMAVPSLLSPLSSPPRVSLKDGSRRAARNSTARARDTIPRAFSLSKTIWDTGVDNTAEEKQLGVGHTERIREHTAIVSLPTWMLILNTNTRNKPSYPSLPPISLGRIVSFFAPPLPLFRPTIFEPPFATVSRR